MSRGVDPLGRNKPVRKRFGSYEGIKETTRLADSAKQMSQNNADQRNKTKRMKSQDANKSCNSSQDEEEHNKRAGEHYNSTIQVMDKKPFDFQKVRVIIKRGN